jgi:protein-S-isoprenylcysteine O-methyltransferase Ste14
MKPRAGCSHETDREMKWTWSRIAQRIRVPLGFVFAVGYIWLADPTWISIGIGCVVAALGVWLRAVAAGFVKKNRELTTSGPYARTRNPLYLGSIIIAIGFAVASRNIWVAVALVVLFFAIYLPVIRSEEAFLRGTFPDYDQYMKDVPRLFPRLTAASGAIRGTFSKELYWKHREYNALVGSAAMMLALALKIVWHSTRFKGFF